MRAMEKGYLLCIQRRINSGVFLRNFQGQPTMTLSSVFGEMPTQTDATAMRCTTYRAAGRKRGPDRMYPTTSHFRTAVALAAWEESGETRNISKVYDQFRSSGFETTASRTGPRNAVYIFYSNSLSSIVPALQCVVSWM